MTRVLEFLAALLATIDTMVQVYTDCIQLLYRRNYYESENQGVSTNVEVTKQTGSNNNTFCAKKEQCSPTLQL